MLKKFSKIALSAFLSISTVFGVASSGLADTVSFESISQIPLSPLLTKDALLYLAEVESNKKALKQALNYLKQQTIFQNSHIDPKYHLALAMSLSQDNLSFALSSSDPTIVQYKSKIQYDPFEFPEQLDDYFHTGLFAIAYYQARLNRNQEFESQVRKYLQKMNQVQDPEYRKHLQETDGLKVENFVKASRYMERSNKYYSKKDYDKGLEQLEKAIELDPQNADFLFIKAIFLGDQEKYDAAIQALNLAIQLKPKDAIFYLLRGAAYTSQGIVLKRGQEDFTRAIELEPKIASSYQWRGLIYEGQGNCSAAEADYKQACQLGYLSACKEKCRRY